MMEGHKFFCSYAREDSEFVLNLAKELRKAGANLWLDRLDILGGQRWDEAVQAALESCQGMLAILSPSSITSQNFMDEVSYALEERKQIIPVLCRECAIPFRLRRVQYVDFVTSYDSGFADLLRALLLDHPPENSAPVAVEGVEGRVTKGATQYSEKEFREEVVAAGEEINAREAQRKADQDWSQVKAEEVVHEAKEGPRGLAVSVAVDQPLSSIETGRRVTLSQRAKGALGAAMAGLIVGTISVLTLGTSNDQDTWWIGALIMGIPGAIAGAITGTARRKVIAALVTALAGVVIVFLFLDGSKYRLLRAVVYGMPSGAIVGAVAGGILKWNRSR